MAQRPIAQRPTAQRWAISLADLSLLLACILYTEAQRDAAKALPDAIMAEFRPDQIFETGEARMTAAGLASVKKLIPDLPSNTRATISVPITETPASNRATRMDDWELAAARTAAIGRAIMVQSRQKVTPILLVPTTDSGGQNGLIRIAATAPAPQLAQSLRVYPQ